MFDYIAADETWRCVAAEGKQDKRAYRRSGGTVVRADNEWHCVGAALEGK